ncbi:MAG: phospholipase [Aeriscardovia sp.]|nr:phospholipase [Aeriscardovia sp.]
MNKEILFNTVKSDMANGTANAISMIKKGFPELSNAQCADITELIADAINLGEADKVSLVVTAPPSFSINARTTMNVIRSMIADAEKSILITGYSLSSYFFDMIDTIIDKSQKGVFVRFYVNDIDSQNTFDKLCRYKGKFLKIYNYHKSEDKLAALHAKVLSVDGIKTLITSANLSYHGQEGNIELGTMIESKAVAKQVDGIFTQLLFSKVFVEI